jgi:hypothetical protein
MKEYPMALPPPPVAANSTTVAAPVAPVAPVVAAAPATGGKVVLKKFGPAKIGEGEAAVAVATPTAAGLNLVELSKAFYATLTNEVSKAGVALEKVLEFCGDADKSQFPGHKDGRIAYATANTVASLGKINGLLNKVRGLGGGAAMKAKIIEKDSKIQALEKQLAELMAQMAAKG